MKIKIYTTLLFACFLFAACNKKTNDRIEKENTTTTEKDTIKEESNPLESTQWVSKEFPYQDKSYTPQKSYRLHFKESKIELQLDVNSCGGSYKVAEDKLSIKDAFCTEMCCDSKQAQDLLKQLTASNKFMINNKTKNLHIESEQGTIIFEPITNNFSVKLMDNVWQAISWADRKAGQHQKFKKKYTLTFLNKGVRLSLDVNNCNTSCKYLPNNEFELPANAMACTRQCCDSDEAKALMMGLQGKITYTINNKEQLILKTFNKEIVFQSISSNSEE